ncbi:MAG: CMP-binding protein, partial [Planctomycetota bacterium]
MYHRGMSDSSSRPTLRELGPAQRFEGAYAISNAQLGTTRSGKPYLRCLLGDRTGKLPARMWNCSEELFRRIPHEGFVYAQGETQPFEGELQLIVHQIDPHEPTPEQLRELLPSTDKDVEQMFQEVVQLLQTLQHPAMRALAQTYLADEMLMDLFKQAPAAKSMHHAYLGGLLEHTLNLLKAADALLPLYPGLNRDIVLMGLFLHDLGKTRELVFDRGFAYSDRGELIGHIVDGAIML